VHSSFVVQVAGTLGLRCGKYWIPTLMPADDGSVRNADKALFTAVHF
jgi:hypothetical protein